MGRLQNNFQDEAGEAFDRTQELTWALIDDCINREEFAELEGRLLNEDAARKSYLDCIHLHSDLTQHFASRGNDSVPSRLTNTPILGFLGSDSGPLTGLNSPTS